MKRILIGLIVMAAALPGIGQATDKLGVGDAVRVTVFQQPDLTTDTRIGEKGTIAMPLLGDVKVAGMSPTEAANAIAGDLKKKQFLKNPQVTVSITTVRSRQVSVMGLVTRPGRYALDDTSTRVGDVIAAAGGIAPGGADLVTVMRDGQANKVELASKDFNLKNGDLVYVDRAPVFYIYGEVTRAGAYRVEPNMTVMQAIAAGGGITPRGTERRLKMRRAGADGKVEESDAKVTDVVKADDVIFVKESLF